MKILTNQFYSGNNVAQIARLLLGKIIITQIDGQLTSARIVETEAYVGIIDKASHSYKGKRTQRNEHMYAGGGICYVYICYGMHHLFNVVTNKTDMPDAVLIRAAEPVEGMDIMLLRTGKPKPDYTLTKGPGNMSKALGIQKIHSGISLQSATIFITDDGHVLANNAIGTSKRIGIDGAGADALLPYRFYIRGNKYVSGSPVK